MRKVLLYAVTAVILGLLITLVPLVTFAKITPAHTDAEAHVLSKSLRDLEGLRADTPTYSHADIEVLAISFVVALIAYILLKRRTPYRELPSLRPPY
ncbi:MAG: hypothetical protein QHH18_05465 [Candidatus Bathyarchaeota archaeon]|nr:hypothetical protein [Candidatus Bathyarchaeota archaeon A05DMB-5]MDH7558037.1 hypothetical protein [Candidatus Bathyarchaeota archaeon]